MTQDTFKPEYLLPGTQIGGYEVCTHLGMGSGVVVYDVVSRAGNHYALKVSRFRPGVQGSRGSVMVGRLGRCILCLQHLKGCQYVAQLRAYDRYPDPLDGWPYLVQDLVPGGMPITEWVWRTTPPVAQVIELFRALAETCGRMADLGICHRDLKPSNILVTPDGTPMMVDFNSASYPGVEPLTRSALDQPVTLIYAPPELASAMYKERVYGEAEPFHFLPTGDLHALGCLFYEVLTADHPFDLRNDDERVQLQEIRQKTPPHPHLLNPAVPFPVEKVVMRLLKKSPEDRYQHGGEVARELQFMLDNLGSNEDWQKPFTVPQGEDALGPLRLRTNTLPPVESPQGEPAPAPTPRPKRAPTPAPSPGPQPAQPASEFAVPPPAVPLDAVGESVPVPGVSVAPPGEPAPEIVPPSATVQAAVAEPVPAAGSFAALPGEPAVEVAGPPVAVTPMQSLTSAPAPSPSGALPVTSASQLVETPRVNRRRRFMTAVAASSLMGLVLWKGLTLVPRPMMEPLEKLTVIFVCGVLNACAGAKVRTEGLDWLASCPEEARKVVTEVPLPEVVGPYFRLKSPAILEKGPNVIKHEVGVEIRSGPVVALVSLREPWPSRGARLYGMAKTDADGASVRFDKLVVVSRGFDPVLGKDRPLPAGERSEFPICALAGQFDYANGWPGLRALNKEITPDAAPDSELHPGYLYVATSKLEIRFATESGFSAHQNRPTSAPEKWTAYGARARW